MLTLDKVLGLVRHALTFAGGAAVTNGLASADEVSAAVGALVTLLGVAASVLAKRKK